MTHHATEEPNEDGRTVEANPLASALMAVYNPPPPQPEQAVRFYWQEPWRESTADAANDAVQAAFEN